MKRISILLVAACSAAVVISSSVQAAHIISADSINKHVSVLAHDSLEGRQVGEPGEWKAAQYIAQVFRNARLEPMGTDHTSYFQPFPFIKKIDFGQNNRLIVNGQALELNEEYLPMRQSASTEFAFTEIVNVDYGIKTDEDDWEYNDYENKEVAGKAVLIKRYSPSEENPHVDFDRYSSLTDKINTAMDHDAAAVLFTTPEEHDDTLQSMGPVRVTPKEIPIVFLRRKGLEKLGLDINNPDIDSVSGAVDLFKVRDTGHNVVGYLPTGNDTTVIIGAHYDHLGWGGPGSGSRYLGEEPRIHNGADDNGSGTAALLELARYYSSRRYELHYSMMFIGFSGEESGILGSSYFVRNMPFDSNLVRMMVNMDMIGRLREQDKGLAIMGTGTCPEFKAFFEDYAYEDLKLTFKESGQTPSDNTAFYNRKIPVLFFFTGAHSDYHKPEDDVDKIDFAGIKKVTSIVTDIVNHFDDHPGPLTFQKTKDPNAGKMASSFSVTLGIMPDYISEVKGLRIDGVSPDRPADNAGLLEGDIIIKMGDIDVGDIYDYMNALGKFRKGDSTVVVVARGADTLNMDVVFK